MLCFPVGFQEYLVHSSKYKSFSCQYSLTWTKTLRFNWTIKLVLSSFIYGSLIRHRQVVFSVRNAERFFSSRLVTFWLTFQIIFFFPHHVASSPPPPLLVAANWQATRWFPFTRSHSNVCRRKAHLKGMVAVVTKFWTRFHDFILFWVEYSVHLRCVSLNWHV